MKLTPWIRDFLLRLLEGVLRSWPTSATLVLANLVPLAGVLLLGWNAGSLLFLYWAETAIVGVWSLPKMAIVSRWLALIFVPVLMIALTIITFMHGIFALTIPLYFEDPAAAITNDRIIGLFREMAWPVFFFAVSHGWSFFYHFLGKGEFRRLDDRDVAEGYFKRVAVTQIGIGVGLVISAPFDSPLGVLIVLVVAKTVLDLRAHLKEHGLIGR